MDNENIKVEELIEKIKEYDNKKYDGKDYSYIMKHAESLIVDISMKGEEVLDFVYPLLNYEDSWSPLIVLGILKRIKSEKSVLTLVQFVQKYQFSDNFEWCDDAINTLIDMGSPSVNELITALNKEFENKVYGGYLDEALSHIKDERVREFRLKILKDFIQNPDKYKGWFNLTLFIVGFREWNTEALEDLKKLQLMKLNAEEKRELGSAIKCIENPEKYQNELKNDIKKIKPLFDMLFKQKIGRNDPCPCGSGKKYKKCCLKL